MSFQDFGKRNAGQHEAPKTGFSQGQHQSGKQSLLSGTRSVLPGSVAQISESLSQFQVCSVFIFISICPNMFFVSHVFAMSCSAMLGFWRKLLSNS